MIHVRVPLTRRSLLSTVGAALALPLVAGEAGGEVPADGPELSVTEALRARRSVRAFADRPVAPPLLAELLWAAFGVNRAESGLHTAPSGTTRWSCPTISSRMFFTRSCNSCRLPSPKSRL